MATYEEIIKVSAVGDAQAVAALNRVKDATTGVQKGASAIKDAFGAMLPAIGIAALAAVTQQLFELGDKVNDAAEAYRQLGGTASGMSALQTATHGIVDNMTLMGEASRFLSQGLADNATQASQLVGIARDLALVFGKDGTQAVDAFFGALSTGRVNALKDFGIDIDAVKQRAQELEESGVRSMEAMRQAIIEVGGALRDNLDVSAFIDESAQVETKWTNLVQKLSTVVNTFGEQVAGVVMDAITAAEQLGFILEHNNQAFTAPNRAPLTLEEQRSPQLGPGEKWASPITTVGGMMNLQPFGQGGTVATHALDQFLPLYVDSTEQMTDAVEDSAGATRDLKEATEGSTAAAERQHEAILRNTDELQRSNAALGNFIQQQLEAAGYITPDQATQDQIGETVRWLAQQFPEMADELYNRAENLILTPGEQNDQRAIERQLGIVNPAGNYNATVLSDAQMAGMAGMPMGRTGTLPAPGMAGRYGGSILETPTGTNAMGAGTIWDDIGTQIGQAAIGAMQNQPMPNPYAEEPYRSNYNRSAGFNAGDLLRNGPDGIGSPLETPTGPNAMGAGTIWDDTEGPAYIEDIKARFDNLSNQTLPAVGESIEQNVHGKTRAIVSDVQYLTDGVKKVQLEVSVKNKDAFTALIRDVIRDSGGVAPGASNRR